MATPVTRNHTSATPSLFAPATPARYNLKLAFLSMLGIILSWLAVVTTALAMGLCVHPLYFLIFLALVPLCIISRYISSHYLRNVFIAIAVVPSQSVLKKVGSTIPDFPHD
ncbi:hypothetical protein C10C_0477 [Chlamydia serpentis]|uniref:Uncharacterized protein n=1 Tax=Chlamydia serpentis TaxID=1967782 RepID=A0A2R8FBE2_9CHLA|nr:hypothetical protein [Chlamydia serpentis]SPN73642.1 hypothetical protein C10C_0477 [Chlamydia serpentis]